MINARIVREAENAPNAHNVNKLQNSEQKIPRLKSKALEDVQNTLHSRSSNFSSSKKTPAIKVQRESSKPVAGEKLVKSTPGKIYVSPTKPSRKLVLSSTNADHETFDFHNHFLCEHDEESYLNEYFSEFKFSEKQSSNLVLSAKIFLRPLSTQSLEPSEDVEVPNVDLFIENSFSVNDILSDIIVPDVSPPLEIL